jgi:sulfur relay (sulfurtransferase) complex TusBCD TusD component (DsrE family)
LTIQKVDEGFILALSDMEERDDESLIFVPETVLISPHELQEAVDSFYHHQQMYRLKSFHA